MYLETDPARVREMRLIKRSRVRVLGGDEVSSCRCSSEGRVTESIDHLEGGSTSTGGSRNDGDEGVDGLRDAAETWCLRARGDTLRTGDADNVGAALSSGDAELEVRSIGEAGMLASSASSRKAGDDVETLRTGRALTVALDSA